MVQQRQATGVVVNLTVTGEKSFLQNNPCSPIHFSCILSALQLLGKAERIHKAV
jgi:hypothetical protein